MSDARASEESEEASELEQHYSEFEVPEEAAERVAEMYRRIDDGEPLVEVVDYPEWICPLGEMFARQRYMQGRYEEAAEMADGIIALDSTRYYPYLLTGLICMEQEGEYETAADCLAKAKELGPDDEPSITYNLAEAFLRTDEPEAGIAHLQETLQRTEDEPDNEYRERAEVLLARLRGAGSETSEETEARA